MGPGHQIWPFFTVPVMNHKNRQLRARNSYALQQDHTSTHSLIMVAVTRPADQERVSPASQCAARGQVQQGLASLSPGAQEGVLCRYKIN